MKGLVHQEGSTPNYGTATAGDVRSTKTFGSAGGAISGTLDLTNITAGNLKSGVTVDGVTGTYNETVFTAGTVEQYVATAPVTKSTTYVKVSDLVCLIAGTYRFNTRHRINNTASSSYSKIYVNYVAAGDEHVNNTTSYVTYTDDLTLAAGDTVQLYIKQTSLAQTMYLSSFTVNTAEPVVAGRVVFAQNRTQAPGDIKQYVGTSGSQAVTSYTLVNAATINFPGAYRVSFSIRSSYNSGVVYGRIYKNGVAVGIERSQSTTSYINYSQDFAGIVAGDVIQLYTYSPYYTVYHSNFTIATLEIPVVGH